ncbi:DUF4625 domain-containing protein [Pontibacter sp. 172403-2]|uniref:DUF4625 domain-containing protein n=1 Tax=Pontibacter rufus TaxID=2791028 RepID=UPI0018AFDFE0|nr:DUF4625 domain-containing protein [Pontibacter sp. 172403-2]MBF9255590.1 DUF4625 domain-containing protein [Pontibacter sp. 172403-2]
MKKLNWLFLMFLAVVFFSCDDEEDVTLDTTAPTITITSPAANATFAAGDVIPLKATIEDNEGLDNLKVIVTDPSGTDREVADQNIVNFLKDKTNKDLEVNIGLDSTAVAGAYVLTVEATDKQNNKGSKSVTVAVM